MKLEEAKVGTHVKTNVDFADVPTGTIGVIVEDYGTGVTVQWALPAEGSGWPLRDGFDKKTELQYLDLAPKPTNV